ALRTEPRRVGPAAVAVARHLGDLRPGARRRAAPGGRRHRARDEDDLSAVHAARIAGRPGPRGGSEGAQTPTRGSEWRGFSSFSRSEIGYAPLKHASQKPSPLPWPETARWSPERLR